MQYARMKRTTISLPDDLAAALEREAARQRVPAVSYTHLTLPTILRV